MSTKNALATKRGVAMKRSTQTPKPVRAAKPALGVSQILLRADVIPTADGRFEVKPRKPLNEVEEITTAEATRILGLKSRSMMYYLMDHPIASKYLVWRRLSPNPRSNLRWELPSILRYKELCRSIGK